MKKNNLIKKGNRGQVEWHTWMGEGDDQKDYAEEDYVPDPRATSQTTQHTTVKTCWSSGATTH